MKLEICDSNEVLYQRVESETGKPVQWVQSSDMPSLVEVRPARRGRSGPYYLYIRRIPGARRAASDCLQRLPDPTDFCGRGKGQNGSFGQSETSEQCQNASRIGYYGPARPLPGS